eukprot:8778173-Pyramimonas_sp.AAC.1
MRYDMLPLPTPRRLTTTKLKSPPTTSDYDLRGHWIGLLSLGSYGSLSGVRCDICGAETTPERLAPIG